jgi:hypothetical protein
MSNAILGYPGIDALCTCLVGSKISILDISNIGLDPAGLAKLATSFTSSTSFSAAMNSLTVLSTGNMREQKVYTLSGLQGGSEPILDLSSLNLGPADMQLLSTLFTTFPNFIAAVRLLDVSKNKIGSEGATALIEAVLNSDIESIVIGPKRTTINGLPGGADPNLDPSSLDLGPEDIQFVLSFYAAKHSPSAWLLTADGVRPSDLAISASTSSHPQLAPCLARMFAADPGSVASFTSVVLREGGITFAHLCAEWGSVAALDVLTPAFDAKRFRATVGDVLGPTVLEMAARSEKVEARAWARGYG